MRLRNILGRKTGFGGKLSTGFKQEIQKKTINKNLENERNDLNRTIKHACRTLLKQACPEVLALFGYDCTDLELTQFDILTAKVKLRSSVEFTFCLKNNSTKNKRRC